jgi:predicted enzyme related to lactoylglutathione lyase
MRLGYPFSLKTRSLSWSATDRDVSCCTETTAVTTNAECSPAGSGVGGAALRFTVDDPDSCEQDARAQGLTVLWPTQDATWGRFLVLADPDGRSVVLAKMTLAV